MRDICISDMMNMQWNLWEAHKNSWSPMTPEYARDSMLFMIEEIGECIAIMKKKGNASIVGDSQVRTHFVEEMSDVLMYFIDTLLRYGITSDEISSAYIEKHNHNLKRDYTSEYKSKYTT